jgi:hypothetical protein
VIASAESRTPGNTRMSTCNREVRIGVFCLFIVEYATVVARRKGPHYLDGTMQGNMRYLGACHCRGVTFELNTDGLAATVCNCSLCRRSGAIWQGARDAQLRITSGEATLALYQFQTMTAKHYFCPSCGIFPFVRPRLAPTHWAVNLRCVDSIDLDALEPRRFDGEHWEAAAEALLRKMARTKVR